MPIEKACIVELLLKSTVLKAVSDSPRLDLEVLLCHVLGKPRSYLFAWPERVLEQDMVQRFNNLLKRRVDGEPIAYLIGEKEFWSLSLEVNSSTLIPRPDTESLVEAALDRVDKPDAKVLDLGTGSGAIALALASEHPGWEIVAVDSVFEAVELAEKNRQGLGLENVSVMQSNWFEDITPQKFDLIVTNPPYIDAGDHHLNDGDVRFEPRSALVSGSNGLADIETIVGQAKQYLTDTGCLLIEHGFQQAQAVRELLRAENYLQISTQRDTNGLDRLSIGCMSLTSS